MTACIINDSRCTDYFHTTLKNAKSDSNYRIMKFFRHFDVLIHSISGILESTSPNALPCVT